MQNLSTNFKLVPPSWNAAHDFVTNPFRVAPFRRLDGERRAHLDRGGVEKPDPANGNVAKRDDARLALVADMQSNAAGFGNTRVTPLILSSASRQPSEQRCIETGGRIVHGLQ